MATQPRAVLSSAAKSTTQRKQNPCLPQAGKIQSSNAKSNKFGEDIIEFVSSLPNTPVNRPLISQVVRAGTSIGANYMEADAAESKKDFRHKIGLCKKESKETMHWLRMIAKANPNKREECRRLWQESKELTLIFSSIIRGKQNVKAQMSNVKSISND